MSAKPQANSTQNLTKSPGEKNKYEQFNLTKKMKIDNVDEINHGKGNRNDKILSGTEENKYSEKYSDLSKQVKEFYEAFRDFFMQEVHLIYLTGTYIRI
jgi:hypothetical protein